MHINTKYALSLNKINMLTSPPPHRGDPHRYGGGRLQGHRRRHLGGLHAPEGGHGEEGPAEGQRGHLQDAGRRAGQVRQEDREGDVSFIIIIIDELLAKNREITTLSFTQFTIGSYFYFFKDNWKEANLRSVIMAPPHFEPQRSAGRPLRTQSPPWGP